MDKLILLVDDDPAVLGVLTDFLRPHFRLRVATRGERALELARLAPVPDLVLLDVRLPDAHGHELCARLKADPLTAAIPVMFLSGQSDVDDIIHGLELGAVDYVSKPVKPPILLARVRTQLRLRETSDLLRDQNVRLESLVAERTRDLEGRTAQLHARSLELAQSQELTIVALGSIAETRDNETGNHIHRTRAYVEVMTRRLADLPRYREALAGERGAMIWKSAPLHDIGKVGIPDHILLKPGPLNPEEFAVMQRHTTIGRDALIGAELRMGCPGSFLDVAKEIAGAHHERWDGKGYPEGLAGDAIPLSARLMAVADVYDAMISRRVYKPPLPHAEAVAAIREGRGTQFDPAVVDGFLEDPDEFRYIASRFADTENGAPAMNQPRERKTG